jgi:hypothetical protein
VFDEWVYVYSKQDVVPVEMTITFSDPRCSDLSYAFDVAWLETGEMMEMDFDSLVGMGHRARQTSLPWHPSYGRWMQVVCSRRTMGRGEQLFFSGRVLAFAKPGRPIEPLVYSSNQTTVVTSPADRLATLRAAALGPVVGVCTGWQGRWLAFGAVPAVPDGSANGGWDDADGSAAAFRNLRGATRDLYAQRPRGLLRRAGSTGGQEDFGACKGAFAVTVGDPRFLYEEKYSVYELFARPFHHREVDGSPMLQRDHPRLRTWSQLVHCATTQDTLGLVCPFPYSWPSNDWSGFDDQHRSQNGLNMLLATTGSHALRAVMKDLLEIDLAQVPNRIDSPRGEGRLMMAWSNMLMLLDDPFDREHLHQHMSDRVDSALRIWPGRNFVGNPERPIRVLGVGSDPTFLEPGSGASIPAIIVWEHSIAVMGYFAAWRLTGDQRYRDLAAELARVIVNHCIFEERGAWVACVAVRYLTGDREGEALPASTYYTGSPDIHLGISFWTWIFPSVLACRELWRGLDPALEARCDQIIAWMGPARTWSAAEWAAVVPR